MDWASKLNNAPVEDGKPKNEQLCVVCRILEFVEI